ncbi:MAG: gene transfer agent family protein [Pseudomonadota bacterium]
MTQQPNTLRGEAEFSIGDQRLIIRPNFQALVAAEEELGSLFALVERASEGELTLAEITGLLWHCMECEHRPSRETVGTAVLACGVVAATKPVRAILAQVIQGQQ